MFRFCELVFPISNILKAGNVLYWFTFPIAYFSVIYVLCVLDDNLSDAFIIVLRDVWMLLVIVVEILEFMSVNSGLCSLNIKTIKEMKVLIGVKCTNYLQVESLLYVSYIPYNSRCHHQCWDWGTSIMTMYGTNVRYQFRDVQVFIFCYKWVHSAL